MSSLSRKINLRGNANEGCFAASRAHCGGMERQFRLTSQPIERKNNPMASNKESAPRAEAAAPTMQPDRKVTQKSALLLALAQPGKPLHNFLLSPTQEAAQIGAAEIAFAMVSKGKTARDVATIFGMIGTGNASALRQYFSENFTGCGGSGEAK